MTNGIPDEKSPEEKREEFIKNLTVDCGGNAMIGNWMEVREAEKKFYEALAKAGKEDNNGGSKPQAKEEKVLTLLFSRQSKKSLVSFSASFSLSLLFFSL